MYCPNCGSQLTPESTFCPSCGVKVAKVQPAAPAPPPAGQICPQAQSGTQAQGGAGVNPPGSISWSMAIPIFRGEVFRQLGLVIGIPFGLLVIFLLVSAGGEPYGFYGAGLIGAGTSIIFTSYLFNDTRLKSSRIAGFISSRIAYVKFRSDYLPSITPPY